MTQTKENRMHVIYIGELNKVFRCQNCCIGHLISNTYLVDRDNPGL